MYRDEEDAGEEETTVAPGSEPTDQQTGHGDETADDDAEVSNVAESAGEQADGEDGEGSDGTDGTGEGERLEVVKAETVDDDGAKGAEGARWYTGEQDDQGTAPSLVVGQGLFELSSVERVIDCSCPVPLETSDCDGPLVVGQALGRDGTVGKEEEDDARPDDGDGAQDDEEELPRLERAVVDDAEGIVDQG